MQVTVVNRICASDLLLVPCVQGPSMIAKHGASHPFKKLLVPVEHFRNTSEFSENGRRAGNSEPDYQRFRQFRTKVNKQCYFLSCIWNSSFDPFICLVLRVTGTDGAVGMPADKKY